MGLLIPHSLAEKSYFSETAKPFTRHLIRVIDIVCCGFLSLHSQKLAVNSWMVVLQNMPRWCWNCGSLRCYTNIFYCNSFEKSRFRTRRGVRIFLLTLRLLDTVDIRYQNGERGIVLLWNGASIFSLCRRIDRINREQLPHTIFRSFVCPQTYGTRRTGRNMFISALCGYCGLGKQFDVAQDNQEDNATQIENCSHRQGITYNNRKYCRGGPITNT